jgi:hypothetical protein
MEHQESRRSEKNGCLRVVLSRVSRESRNEVELEYDSQGKFNRSTYKSVRNLQR